MIFADTSVWIEFLRGREPIAGRMAELLDVREIITHEIVFGELLQGARGKRELHVLQDYWRVTPQLHPPELFLQAGELARTERYKDHGAGLLDAALVTAARSADAKFWTLDEKLGRLLRARERVE